MPSTITSTSFLGCYNLSKIYIGKDVYIKKIDLSTTNINHLTTPEKYNPLTENNIIAIGDKELVKFPKQEEEEKEQVKELNNSINTLNQNIQNLNQELTKEKLNKGELQKTTAELQNQVNTLNIQLDNTLKASDMVYNLLGQLSSKKNLLERTSEVIQKFVDLNKSLTELQSADKKVKVQEGVINNLQQQVKNKDKELQQKNNQIASLNGQVSSLNVQVNNPAWIDKFNKNNLENLKQSGFYVETPSGDYYNRTTFGLAELRYDAYSTHYFLSFYSPFTSLSCRVKERTNIDETNASSFIREKLKKLTKL